MKNIDKEMNGYNFNNQKFVKQTETKQRNHELFLLSALFVFCESVLWYFVRSISINLWVTAGLLILYVLLFVDIIEYNRTLRNVNHKVKEFLNREEGRVNGE